MLLIRDIRFGPFQKCHGRGYLPTYPRFSRTSWNESSEPDLPPSTGSSRIGMLCGFVGQPAGTMFLGLVVHVPRRCVDGKCCSGASRHRWVPGFPRGCGRPARSMLVSSKVRHLREGVHHMRMHILSGGRLRMLKHVCFPDAALDEHRAMCCSIPAATQWSPRTPKRDGGILPGQSFRSREAKEMS